MKDTDASTYKSYIYFFGLICHMGYGPRKHFAAIVRDKKHTPVIRYDPDGASQYGENIPIGKDTESVKFAIRDNITEADAEATPDFLRFVPSLQMLMGGSPRINIKNYAIPLYYPETEGAAPDLDVFRLYDDAAWYHRFGHELRALGCVARLTGIVVEAPYRPQLVLIKGDGSPNTVYSNLFDHSDCIVIANLPDDSGMGHVMRYGQILIGNESIVDVLKPYDCPDKAKWKKDVSCDWLRRWLDGGPASADVECGNTGWP